MSVNYPIAEIDRDYRTHYKYQRTCLLYSWV